MGLASIMPEYIVGIFGGDPDVRAVPLKAPHIAPSVGLITPDRDPVAPLIRVFREAAAAFSTRGFAALPLSKPKIA
jgi:DNA-binding transcriptional LysR family regulator